MIWALAVALLPGAALDKVLPYRAQHGAMKPADQVREFVARSYVEPARKRGDAAFTVRVGDVHAALRFTNRLPSVCAALGANLFRETHKLELLKIEGPINGANTTYTFRLLT